MGGVVHVTASYRFCERLRQRSKTTSPPFVNVQCFLHQRVWTTLTGKVTTSSYVSCFKV